ncbi:MAG: hypothetical protein KGH98_02920 [Candidatus Micrarchaeota archaeon]|nr:hypothetical protein [Candidatus Micrarchaeota archaeon]
MARFRIVYKRHDLQGVTFGKVKEIPRESPEEAYAFLEQLKPLDLDYPLFSKADIVHIEIIV